MYDYMALQAEKHNRRHDRIGLFDFFTSNILQRNGIQLRGKNVLDVSGGNGYFAKQLQDYGGCRVVLTEYNQLSVDYAREKYGLEAVRFDFQKDCISDLFSEKFDLVLLRFAIMFCLDPAKFFRDLRRIIHENSLIVIQGSVVPSLGVFLRWEFDDYTYLILYDPDVLINIIKGEG